ncbi:MULTISPECIES: ABC transporter permease [Klebsiella]|jgi:glutathione transport system permease protein|uniref:Glutathione transport system permease protein GsiC n=3 Tax=Klebsiella TaxID=570 RepID=A0AAP0YSC6_KLEAE|nr:ABC transporter permease [Klebsiella aerogenes]AEG99034.1 glutathione ABC transporter permease GsiC [Klebsiella aerogenes KCTC 2190]AMH08076.1 ABC transporter permease [Klebsiella aerogenes]AML34992.1 Glutathione transport system permease protein GsiC [Klebsiella aerogenes]AMQ62414.1 ABC transporter permease [Klebsiella aerogenes]ATM91683.1 ABC transporter permease [Klebsiella aerogenes]
MKAYVIKKLLSLPLILLGASLIVFLAIRMLPGDPARLMAGPQATQDDVSRMHTRLGLDDPLAVQYGHFVSGMLKGDFGTSLKSGQPVSAEMSERVPYTLGLALLAWMMAVILGIPMGMCAAIYRNHVADHVLMLVAIAGASIANFWLALIAMDTFSVKLGWLPLLGAEGWKSYILPSVCLGIFPMAVMSRMTRSSMVDVLGEDYIRTARAKGLAPFQVYFKHALRNALIPIVTIIALNFGSLIGGAVVTESVFNWPGIGRYLVDSVRYRDYPVIQGVTMITVASVVVMNLVGEMIIARINPKIRFD